MTELLGPDRGFTTCSLTPLSADGVPLADCGDQPGAVYRMYDSVSQAAAENGLSRILVGIHFRKDVDEGLHHGRQIADRTVRRLLRPVD